MPIVYIIENNLYGISVDIRKVTKVHDLSVRDNPMVLKELALMEWMSSRYMKSQSG